MLLGWLLAANQNSRTAGFVLARTILISHINFEDFTCKVRFSRARCKLIIVILGATVENRLWGK